MGKFNGTKGNWKYRIQAVESNGFYIETVDKSHRNTFIGEVGGGLQTKQEILSNAKLIASAPEMLEMLNKLVPILKQRLLHETAIKVENLIIKATE